MSVDGEVIQAIAVAIDASPRERVN